MINEEQRGSMEQHRRDESLEKRMEEVFCDVDTMKDNLMKLLENEFVMINLGA